MRKNAIENLSGMPQLHVTCCLTWADVYFHASLGIVDLFSQMFRHKNVML